MYNFCSPVADGEAVPAQHKQGWGQFLKQITSFTGDLSALTAPPFILSPTSLTEFASYWGEPVAEFESIASGTTPEERQLLVTKWYIATLSGQFTRREKETGSEKKPLNPFLGEQFIGSWKGGDLVLHAEQVSHHPPITAYNLEHRAKGIVLEGNCAQKTSFSGRTIVVKQVGHAIVSVKLSNGEVEKYLITLPKLKIEGLWYGAPYIELDGTSMIQSSTGYLTTVSYAGKGWVSGKAHTFTATLTKSGSSSTIQTITGTWTGESHFKGGSKDGQLFLNAAGPTNPIEVKPVEQQGEFESRRAWKAVADGIRKGDFDSASAAKSALENSERQKRKDEQSAGHQFQLRLFDVVTEDPEYTKLAAMCKHSPSHETSYTFKRNSA
ncbi:Oxysterol-binding protein 4 [Microbotryomycetes sp. JL221]|nr:Oxysterol-binding protein 4 [Microbotryomycetes sp. JL221]